MKMTISPNMRIWHRMCVLLWLLVEFAHTGLNAACDEAILPRENDVLNDSTYLSNASSSYNAECLHESQGEIEEIERLARLTELDEIMQILEWESVEEGIYSADNISDVSKNDLQMALEQHEPNHCAQEQETGTALLSGGTTSKEFCAQMAKEALSLKNTLPPHQTALNETLALMNSRVLFPSAFTVRWFSNRGSSKSDLHEPLAILHRKCAFAYRIMSERARSQKETALLRTFLPFAEYTALPLRGAELKILARHRKYISMLANHIIYAATGITTAHAKRNGQNFAKPPTFKYSAFTTLREPRLCACFAVQLLISGFFSYIPDAYFSLIQNILAPYGARLVSYVLGPGCVEVFPEFITAFYILQGGMCTDAKSPALLEYHRGLINYLPTSMRLLYGKGLVAQQSHLSTLVAACSPGLRALGAGELTEGDVAYLAATEEASVYWHALSALALLIATVPESDRTEPANDSLDEAVGSETEHTARADRLVGLISLPIANTASLSCWAAVLTALIHSMPPIDVYAFIVARTPPAFAGPLLRYEVVNPAVYILIVSLWLVFEMPHADSILANLDAMYSKSVYRYKALLLMRLPVRLFARAPPKLLRRICRILFEQECARAKKQQGKASLKRQAGSDPEAERCASKRSCSELLKNAGPIVVQESAQGLSSGNPASEAQGEALLPEDSTTQKSQIRACHTTPILKVEDACERLPDKSTFGNDPTISPYKLSLSLYIPCRVPDDISNEELAYLIRSRGSLHYFVNLCNMAANEVPQMQYIDKIAYLKPSLEKVNRELLEIFRAPSHSVIPARASDSGSLDSVGRRSQNGAARAGIFKAYTHNFDDLNQFNQDGHSSTSGASQASDTAAHDISWDMYANCKHCMTTLPAFFIRQLLPRIVDVICTCPYLSSASDMLKMVGYILDSDGLENNMRLLEEALSDVAAMRQEPLQENLGSPPTAAQPDMPHFILKSNPAIRLSLENMELHIQQRVSSNLLDARAYMEISDALHRLVFRTFGSRNFTTGRIMIANTVRCILMRIVRLLPRECPFIYQASGSVEQAQLVCTWSPVFRAPPSRASPSAIPDDHIVNAMCNACCYSLHAMSTDTHVEEWLGLFTWLVTRSAVQSFIASPSSLLLVKNDKAEKSRAATIASCLIAINSLIANIMKDKSNGSTGANSNSNRINKRNQATMSRDALYRSLKTKLIQMLFLFNTSDKVLAERLAKLRKASSLPTAGYPACAKKPNKRGLRCKRDS